MTGARWLRLVLACLCVFWPSAALAESAARGLRAERFDVVMTLLPDGSVEVRETVVLHFTERMFSTVEREISLRRFDGVIDVRASLDGHPLGADGAQERVRVRLGRRSLRVVWTFPDTINQTRTFRLEYRAMGALQVLNGRASLDWIVLPSRHRYPIDNARVEWRVPGTAVRVEPTTLDDPRWTASAMADGWAADRRNVGVDETVRMIDAFDAASLAATMPSWQVNADRARQMAPAFVIGALTLLVMAAGIVGMTWFRFHQPGLDWRRAEPAEAGSQPAAMGAVLAARGASVGLPHVQAALLDLARRSVIQIRESTETPGRFDVIMSAPSDLSQAPTMRRHEQAMTDVLWQQVKKSRMDLRMAWRCAARALPAFRRALIADMQDDGLMDRERQSAARHMLIAGVVVTALGVAGFALFGVVFAHLGDLPLLVPGAVVVSGIGFLASSRTMSLLSPEGLVASAAWRARRHWLTAATKSPMSAADVARWLPVAAGCGLARSLLKAGKGALAQDAAALEWLGPVSNAGAALAILIATMPAAPHHGVGGGGAGAGGGSSSAR